MSKTMDLLNNLNQEFVLVKLGNENEKESQSCQKK
jgi:hypothetical protein